MKDATFHGLNSKCWNKIKTLDFSCQASQKSYRSSICTCRKHKKTQILKRNTNSEQSSIDLGVERIKVVHRKKIVVYLPENKGVLNVTKNLTSKCVGGSVSDQNTGDTLKNIQHKHTPKKSCEFNKRKIKRSDPNTQQGYIQTRVQRDIHGVKKISNPNKETNKIKNYPIGTKNHDKLSSDSSIERIYNLESSTSDTSKILSISNDDNLKGCNSLSLKNNSKSCRREPQSELRSPTIIEKANEILKQGLSWIRDSSKDLIGRENFTKAINKEVSVTSSPPSLTARSVSSTKFLSPKASAVSSSKTERLKDSNKKEKSLKEETKAEDVRTMFKLWEKKFNFENESNIPNAPKTGNVSVSEEKDIDISKNNDLKDTQAQDHKKRKNIFSFFRKKNKDKSSFKGKKVTAGRCELGDGIVIKIGLDHSGSISSSKKIDDTKIEKNILQQSWLKKFVTNSGDSQKSVQLRWDNKTYGTSSNTISDLKNYTFHDASIILQSNTKLSPKVTSHDGNHPKHSVNFKQDIKACMIPKTICQTPVNKNSHIHDNKKIFLSNSKKFKAKSKNHIEIFLPARHFSRNSNRSSEYITIHIPEEYFSEESEDQNQYTDEEVYNIVEYESNKSENVLKDDKIAQKFQTGDYLHNYTKENRQTIFQACRGVVLQQNNACLPKVTEVGVITHRDNITCLEKSMKPQDNPNESQNRQPQRKCDLAENYLLDYCRNAIPHGLDLDTSQISKSQWQLISLHSSDNYSNSGQCTDLNVMSSKSSTERGSELSKINDWKQIHTHHFFSKIRKKTCSPLPPCNIRTCPKDSIEVCKKRKIYACSNKSKWGNNSIDEKPKIDGKISAYSTETVENCIYPYADMNERPLDGILKFKGASDCSNCKKNEKLPRKAATVNADSICQIPQPPCLEKCSSVRNPICTKTNSPTCHARSPECLSQELKVSQTEPSQTKVTQTKPHQVTPSSSHAICLNAKKSDAKREAADETSQIDCFCSGEENVLPTSQSTDPLKETLPSGHYVPPPVCPLDPNSYCCCKPNSSSFTSKSKATLSTPHNKNITTTFYQRSLNISNRKKCNCIGKRNIVTSKCAPDDPNCKTNMNTKKDSSNLLNTKLSPKSSSKKEINDSEMRAREDWNSEEANKDEEERKDNKKSALIKSESAKDKSNKIESMNSNKKFCTKEKTDTFEGIHCDEIERTKEETNGIEGVNREEIPKKKDGSKEKTNKIEKPNCDEILNTVYKDPNQMIKEQKSQDNSGIQRKLSISDIIEINICLKFTNTGTSKSRIKPQYAYNVDEKSDIQNISTNYLQTCPTNENEGSQIKGQTEDINFTINIQSVRPNCNSSNNNYSLNNARMFKTDNSINDSEHFLHDHRPTLDFTNSINKVTFANEQIANFEMTCGTNFTCSEATDSSIVINEDVTKNYSNNNTTDNNSETSDFNSHHKIEVINDLQKEIEKNEDALSANESIKDIVNRKLVSILKKLQRNEKKEVLKQILEIVGNMNCERKGKKVKLIKHLMQAVLSSDSEHDQENDIKSTRRPLDNPSKITLNRTGCCCNKKVNVEEQNCCCNKIDIETKNCCCKNVKSDEKCCYKKVDISKESSEIEQGISAQEEENVKAEVIQDSNSIKMESIIMTEVSTTIESMVVSGSTKMVSSICSPLNHTRQTKEKEFVYLASDKVLFFLSDSKDNIRKNISRKLCKKSAHALQLRETKKAVLKIYCQRRTSKSIIKLPKFISHRQRAPQTISHQIDI